MVERLNNDSSLTERIAFTSACASPAIPGMCGEKTASPSIKFYWKNGVLDYQFYVDFEASPMIMKAYSGTDHAFFEQAFENLLHDFEDILESQENSKK